MTDSQLKLYRVVMGWSYYQDFDNRDDALAFRDHLLAGNPVWDSDPLFQRPTLLKRDGQLYRKDDDA